MNLQTIYRIADINQTNALRNVKLSSCSWANIVLRLKLEQWWSAEINTEIDKRKSKYLINLFTA